MAAHKSKSQSNAPIANGKTNTIFGFCPTYRPRYLEGIQSDRHMRSANHVRFSGYREVSMINVIQSVIWRRIVVWSYSRINPTIPPIKQIQGGDYLTRQITPLDETDQSLQRFLFQGTMGLDFTADTIHQAPLNTANFTVVKDRVRIVNPNFSGGDGTNGKVLETKDWIPGGKVVFEHTEAGSKDLAKAGDNTGWSSLSRESRGNLYVFDVFNSPGSTKTVGSFQPEGTVYWTEG